MGLIPCPHTSSAAKIRRKFLPNPDGYGEYDILSSTALTYQLFVTQVDSQVAQGSGCCFHHSLAVVGQEVSNGRESLLLAQR